ncbi:NAD(P)H-binding protein [Planctomonas sp. JC2975]|uniref:SDR family oxidoreductase n=1 Tax=Planctomonas sp. JC2975 TaxID=2729626 RepID=UPI0014744AAA|nr:NAD(P)H-binding protein [Planctomonas sp. JC2975]NNC12224.1 NAD(P)H-binding protein [Planctomonas sp. JC2975]
MSSSIPGSSASGSSADHADGLVLVTGGAGTLGTMVVDRLRDRGRTVRVVSRRGSGPRDDVEYVAGDLETGSGVADAVAGVDTIIHCAGSQKGDGEKARRLVEAARAAGIRHLVYISVAGADRIPVHSKTDHAMFEYFAQKREGELVIEKSGIPFTTLRATQFFELVLPVAESVAKLPVVPLPKKLRVQPIAANEVAGRLVALAEGAPAGYVPELGGPRVYTSHELVREYLRSEGRHRLIMSVGLPGGAAKAVLHDAIISKGAERGTATWEEFLAHRRAAAVGA